MEEQGAENLEFLPPPSKLMRAPFRGDGFFYRRCYDLLDRGISYAVPRWGIRDMQSLDGKFLWGYFSIGLAAVPDAEPASDTITGCVLTFNSALTIGAALASIRPVVDRILVVDSGSTDGTLDIARRCADEVVSEPWPNSYAAQRNFAFGRINTDWTFVLDSDEFINTRLADGLRPLIGWSNRFDVDVVWLARHWLSGMEFHGGGAMEFKSLRGHWLFWPDPQARLMRMAAKPRYQRAVHCQLFCDAGRKSALFSHEDGALFHVKHISASYEERRRTVEAKDRLNPGGAHNVQLLPAPAMLANYKTLQTVVGAEAYAYLEENLKGKTAS